MLSPAYHIDQSYSYNYSQGPFYSGPLYQKESKEKKPFLGRLVNSTFGVAAGPLLNSRWISLYASLGFDILTYKTVRTQAWPCYSWPNIVLLDVAGQLTEADPQAVVRGRASLPAHLDEVSLGVSFGMPSADPDVWQEDVAKSKASLLPGQVLIVSVVGMAKDSSFGETTSEKEGQGLEALAQDFARCAQLAAEAGADVVEANYSCPNVHGPEGRLFSCPEEAGIVAQAIREKIGPVPLLLKIASLTDTSLIKELLTKVSPFVDGLTLSNGLVRTVAGENGLASVFSGRPQAGVVGACIKKLALDTVNRFVAAAQELNVALTWLAVGGVTRLQDVRNFHAAGAHAVLSGTAAIFYPQMAKEFKEAGLV